MQRAAWGLDGLPYEFRKLHHRGRVLPECHKHGGCVMPRKSRRPSDIVKVPDTTIQEFAGQFAVFYWETVKYGPAPLVDCLKYMADMKPTDTAKPRRCMTCKIHFLSTHAGHRRCTACKTKEAATHDSYV